MRAKEVPYEHIAKELGISKPTLIKWGRELETEISNLKALALEVLQEKYYVSKKKRLELFGEQLNRLNQEMAKRDLSDISTEKLIELQMKLVTSLKQEELPISLKEKRSLEDSLLDCLENSFIKWEA